MDFSLKYTKEQEEFAREVREWLDKNIPKGMINFREAQKMSKEQWLKRRELARKLGEKGWLYPSHPRQYGGGGLDADHSFVVNKELSDKHIGQPPHFDSGGLAVAAIIACGTEEQKKRFLPPILRGEATIWQLFTEPEAGTDEANQQTNALRHTHEGEYFIVNGQKIFVGGLYPPPTNFLLLTRSDPEAPRHQNLAMFIAPGDLPGVTIQPLDLFPSSVFNHVSSPAPDGAPGYKYTVFFDDVRIHESYLLGREKEGWRAASATLTAEHGEREGGSVSVKIVRNYIAEKFFEQCRNNRAVVKRLKENPQLVNSVVDIYISTQIERLFSIRNAWLPGSRQRLPYAGPQLTLYSKMFGSRIITDIATVMGPYAFTEDTEWGLEEDLFEVGERCGICLAPGGTPEALKINMSRALAMGR